LGTSDFCVEAQIGQDLKGIDYVFTHQIRDDDAVLALDHQMDGKKGSQTRSDHKDQDVHRNFNYAGK
jgi:hypothetical protein